VTPDDVHPLQCWWGMPRRIRLDFCPCEPPRACDLTGKPDSVQVATWRQRPQGANYAGWGDQHPLTPRYRIKPGSEILPLHPQPGGVGYRHWLGLVVSDQPGEAALRFPASTVSTWRRERQRAVWGGEDRAHMDRLLAAGFDMDNMKARGFVESELPLPVIADEDMRKRVDELSRHLVGAADQAANLLRRAVREALFGPGATVKLDWELLSAVREQLWEATEQAFYDAIRREARHTPDDPDHARRHWLEQLRNTALKLFDLAAPLEPDGATLPRSDEGIRRLLAARRNLGLAFAGYRKEGEALFTALGLPTPERKIPKKKGRAR
jgi:CRISPR system Cascade subunit CasA